MSTEERPVSTKFGEKLEKEDRKNKKKNRAFAVTIGCLRLNADTY